MKTILHGITLLITVFITFTEISPAQNPFDGPPVDVKVYGSVAPGYIFMAPFPINDSTPHINCIYILDSAGSPVVYLPGGETRGNGNLMLQQNGLMTFNRRTGPNVFINCILDSNFNIIDSVRCANGYRTGTHEFLITPENNYLLKCIRDTTVDLSGILTSNGIPGAVNGKVDEEIIQIQTPAKAVIWEWKTLDHYDIDDTYSFYFTDPNYLDHAHFNSVDIAYDGHYIVSHRHLNEISKINSVTGNLIWRLGGKNNQFTLTGDTVFFSGQHDARLFAGNYLTVFDNSLFSPRAARAVEYKLDTINMNASMIWEHRNQYGYPSAFVGNNQVLNNNNRMINWGGLMPLSQTKAFTEVDENGNVLMELDLPINMVSYRTRKYELPFDIKRPVIGCKDDELYIVNDTYNKYYWNTGDSTSTITPQDTGTYQVWCNKGIGFVSSMSVHVTDLNDICGSIGIETASALSFEMFPNPAGDRVHLRFKNNSSEKYLHIYNLQGREIKFMRIASGIQQVEISTSDIPSGMYLVNINGHTERISIVR